MRAPYPTITPAVARATAGAAVPPALPWEPYGRRVPVARLLNLLLLVASPRSALSAVARRFRFGFSHEAARQAVAANLPDLPALTAARVRTPHRFGRHLRRRRWVVALGLPYRPSYGDPTAPGVVGAPKEQGAHYFSGYATAELAHRRHRYPVGLSPLAGGPKPHQVVAALLEQLGGHGLRLRGVVLDSGSDSGDVLLLRARGLA
jgi:hypothetical protein